MTQFFLHECSSYPEINPIGSNLLSGNIDPGLEMSMRARTWIGIELLAFIVGTVGLKKER